MSIGPITIFDKSALQALNLDEAVWLDNFYLCNITPLFFDYPCQFATKQSRRCGPSVLGVVGPPKQFVVAGFDRTLWRAPDVQCLLLVDCRRCCRTAVLGIIRNDENEDLNSDPYQFTLRLQKLERPTDCCRDVTQRQGRRLFATSPRTGSAAAALGRSAQTTAQGSAVGDLVLTFRESAEKWGGVRRVSVLHSPLSPSVPVEGLPECTNDGAQNGSVGLSEGVRSLAKHKVAGSTPVTRSPGSRGSSRN
jgi:hypothetical protein